MRYIIFTIHKKMNIFVWFFHFYLYFNILYFKCCVDPYVIRFLFYIFNSCICSDLKNNAKHFVCISIFFHIKVLRWEKRKTRFLLFFLVKIILLASFVLYTSKFFYHFGALYVIVKYLWDFRFCVIYLEKRWHTF